MGNFYLAITDLNCDFESHDICNWANDNNNWLTNWKVHKVIGDVGRVNRAVCVASPKMSEAARLKNEILTIRLWSPSMTADQKLRCFSFKYNFFNGLENKLTIMRREMG